MKNWTGYPETSLLGLVENIDGFMGHEDISLYCQDENANQTQDGTLYQASN